MLQHIAQRFLVRPVRLFRQQDDRPQNTERQRRRDAIRLPDGDLPPQRMRRQPLPGKFPLHRQRHPEFPPAPPVGHREKCRAEHQSRRPDKRPHRNGCPDRSLPCGLLCHRSSRKRRSDRWMHSRHRITPPQQRIDTQARGQRKWHQQPQQRRSPEQQKRLFWHFVDRQRPEHRDDHDHHAARKAHLQKLHPRHLIPAPRRSAGAARSARPRASSAPAAPQTACRRTRRTPC